jgi:alkylation response protein AidB-like acyl-CoA dehydrogenase
MDLNDTPEEAAFRAEVRAWLQKHAPAYRWGPGASGEERLRLCRGWMAAKAAAGYAGITLPKDLGGRGGTPIEDLIFREEEAQSMMGGHDESFGGGLVGMAIPTILAHAQPGWAEKLIPPSLRGDILWCQLFSEPGAGSDMAGFRTRAVRQGDHWIVNGQKIWTSGAHNADWGLLLARSDPSLPKHRGLTYFIVDMKTPGIEVRPLKQISGRADFNEVFLTHVRIPDNQRLGEVNDGWNVAITTMMNERLTLLGDPSVGRDVLAPLIRMASRTPGSSGGRLTEETGFREKIASYYVAIAGTQHIRARIRTALGKGIVPGPEATIGKMTTSRWLQEMAIYAMDAIGPASAAIDPEDDDLKAIQECYFLAVGFRIGGGTEEIGKNIIAERILGLPQEPRPDKEVPFSESSSWGLGRER